MQIIRILPLIFLTLTLWSCSSSEHDEPMTPQPNPQQVGINFGSNSDSWQEAPTTRANTTGLETLFNTFRVWGYKTTDANLSSRQTVMDGYKVDYNNTSSTGEWTYVGISNPNLNTNQTVKYWDYSATSYRFLAYSPFGANITPTNSETETSFAIPYTYSDEATATSTPYVSDLWLSTNKSPNPLYGECVKLTFASLIAKVRFKFIYPQNTYTIDVKELEFCDIRFKDDRTLADTPLSGTITATYPTSGNATSTSPQLAWTAAESNATGAIVFDTPYEEANDAIHIVDDPANYGKWYYVPPLSIVPYTQGAYTISAKIDGIYTSTAIPAEYMQWQPGYKYTYVFKITEAGSIITFTDLQVEKWEVGANTDNNGKGTEGW